MAINIAGIIETTLEANRLFDLYIETIALDVFPTPGRWELKGLSLGCPFSSFFILFQLDPTGGMRG